MKKSAGLLLYRKLLVGFEVMLVHPGGPFWKKKDLGAWSIPKGEYTDDEEPFHAAVREFKEETGFDISINEEETLVLKSAKQKSGKIIKAYAIEKYFDTDKLVSNTFELEWPPKSGKIQEFPEIDKGEWFTYENALKKIIPGQTSFIEELKERLI